MIWWWLLIVSKTNSYLAPLSKISILPNWRSLWGLCLAMWKSQQWLFIYFSELLFLIFNTSYKFLNNKKKINIVLIFRNIFHLIPKCPMCQGNVGIASYKTWYNR